MSHLCEDRSSSRGASGGELLRVDVNHRNLVDDVEARREQRWQLPVWPSEEAYKGREESKAEGACHPSDSVAHAHPEALV